MAEQPCACARKPFARATCGRRFEREIAENLPARRLHSCRSVETNNTPGESAPDLRPTPRSQTTAFEPTRPHATPTALRVLVVDDDDSLRRALVQSLHLLGHTVSSARDGIDAWRQQLEGPFDVIVTDWIMPGLDGRGLTERVRQQNGSAYTYVILMTAMVERDRLTEALYAGADDFIRKPVEIDELAARLVTAARVTASHKRLAERNTALRKTSETALRIARVDPLTNAANRLALEEDMRSIEQRDPTGLRRYCAALCDVDDFKLYNDQFGHVAGDGALRRIADLLRFTLRRCDVVYRYGGEEFLVLLADQSLAQAARAMERARAGIEQAGIPHATKATASTVLTVTIGIAERIPTRHETSREWVDRADHALYEAKRAGKNRIATAE